MAGRVGSSGESAAAAEAIVVLGCRPNEQLNRRVACGARLYQAGAAPLLVLTGGGPGPAPEAAAMRQLARAAGVPEAALVCEPLSRSTAENALYTARLLRERGRRRILLVSDRTHLPRARLLFRLAGLTVVGSAGVPERSTARAVRSLLHNIAALPRGVAEVLRRR